MSRAAARSFARGFRLPFALIAATLSDAALRRTYLRVTLVRLLVVAALAALGGVGGRAGPPPRAGLNVDLRAPDGGPGKPVHFTMPGVEVDIDPEHDREEVVVLGERIPTKDARERERRRAVESPRLRALEGAYAWLVALAGAVTLLEGIVVALSRRWDDWLSFHASRLAGIRPEEPTPRPPKVALDVKWLYRKLRRRLRGYVVFAAGVPVLLVLRLVPSAGPWLFGAALTAWGWYWLAIFTAAKSAHAWADDGVAPPPLVIRTFHDGVRRIPPLRWYARFWGWLTRGLDAPTAVFERDPAAYLGLALARAVLAVPVAYLFARPVVPVAAGKLCSDADPERRFAIDALSP